MGVIKYSALVESIRGKINGSTLRVSNGIGIIQNKPYRNPVGMRGVGDNTRFLGSSARFYNRLYHQAVQQVAHEGNPFSDSVAAIRDIIRDWGFTKQADNGTDTAVVATVLQLYYQYGITPAGAINTIGLLPDPNSFDYSITAEVGGIAIRIDTGGTWNFRDTIIDLSPPSPIINYRLRQRVDIRWQFATDSMGNIFAFLPNAAWAVPPVVGTHFWLSLQLQDVGIAFGLSPRSRKIQLTVE